MNTTQATYSNSGQFNPNNTQLGITNTKERFQVLKTIPALTLAPTIKKELLPKPKNMFPVEVFPQQIQTLINSTQESLLFPKDFTGAAILYATSVAIGNNVRIEVKRGWQESPIVYIAIVSKPGANKSHPLNFILKPFKVKDTAAYEKYRIQKKEYDRLQGLPKNKREQEKDLPKPTLQKYLVSDATLEALTEVHSHNNRGIGVHIDELAGWVKNFNRYNNGSEQEFWLSSWSATPITVDRVSRDPVRIERPFISVIGTMQPALLHEMAKDNRNQNGFIDRILFVSPDELKKARWTDTDLDPEIEQGWHHVVENLLERKNTVDENGDAIPLILKFSASAFTRLKEWQAYNTDLVNEANDNGDEDLGGIYTKLENHIIRLSLLLQGLYWACYEADLTEVGEQAVAGAIELAEYFRAKASKTHGIISSKSNPVNSLSTRDKKLFEALPPTFTTGMGVEISARLGIQERKFKHFIKNQELFIKVKHGEYEKQY